MLLGTGGSTIRVPRTLPARGRAPSSGREVTLKPGAGDVDPDEIIEFCRERLAHFKAPKTIVFGELPKTSTGKVQKYLLRDRAREL